MKIQEHRGVHEMHCFKMELCQIGNLYEYRQRSYKCVIIYINSDDTMIIEMNNR